MDDYLTGIDEDLRRCIKSGNFRPSMLNEVGSVGSSADVNAQANKKKENDKLCMRELRGALPPVVYNYVCGCSAKEIWDTLKDKYQGSEKTKKSFVKQFLLELGDFKKKEHENVELYYDRLTI